MHEVAQRPSERRSLEVDLFRLSGFESYKKIDLARAKSEALIHIYSSLKQNTKSCNSKRQRQRKQPKKSVGLISKKTTLHVQHTFFVHFCAVVLHDFNVKLPETS